MFTLEPERPEDVPEVEMLLDTAFAPGRRGLSSYSLREGIAPVGSLCWLMRDEFDALAASIRYWPVRIGQRGDAALLLGPIAVHPTRQGEGLGRQLIVGTLERAVADGWVRVILVGDEPYYSRFGFRRTLAEALEYPRPVNTSRVLAKELVPGSMQNVTGPVRRWADN